MPEPRSKPDDVFDVERIRKLIELMKEHELAEVDLRQSQQRIRICRGGQAPIMVAPGAMMAPSMPTPLATASAPASPTMSVSTEDEAHIAIIRSPMVGTFYTKANPNSKNFVEVGSEVSHDTTVCIIEAMKVFNEIPAEIRGKVVAVLVKNEEAVDHGKPLFKIDTRG
jgi:acetyl-CoA carboxylase biotin carboxyl carrier protein